MLSQGMSRTPLPPFAALKAFDAFGRLGGVRKAAVALGISHAIVSRHLRALEAHLGVVLIDRAAGGLTDRGQVYHDRVASALAQLADATDAIAGIDDGGLHIWCVPGFAYHWLGPRLAGFRAAWPAIDLDLRPSDSAADFVDGAVDGDIRYLRDGTAAASRKGLRMTELARPSVYPVASPALASRCAGLIGSVGDLLAAPLIQESDDGEWRSWFEAQGVATGALKPVARLWHAHLALAAAREGQGIALANDYLVGADLAAGRLVPVVPRDGRVRPVTLGAYMFIVHEDRRRKTALARFCTWLQSTIADERPGGIAPIP